MTAPPVDLAHVPQFAESDIPTREAALTAAIIAQLPSSGTSLGIEVASAPSAGTALRGDGATDDGPALAALLSAISSAGVIYFTPLRTYRIATAVTIPAGVQLQVPAATILQVDGVTLTIRGPIQAGLYQIFQCVNGGQVLFTASNVEAANKRSLRMPEVYPEWWGAVADNATDDAPAINACIMAVSGLPSATSGSRWASAMIRLSQGSYRVLSTIRVASLHGLRIEGAGYQTSRIVWGGGGATGTATAGGVATLTDTTKHFAVNAYAPGATTLWYIYIFGGTGAGQWGQIATNTADTLTVASNWTTAPDATSQYYVVPQAVLDLDGAFDCQLGHLSVLGGSSTTSVVRHGIYYHWQSSVSAAASSRLKAYAVQVTGDVIDSAFQLGGSDSKELNQADMAGLFGCQVIGGWTPTRTDGLYQNGFGFGSGVFSNPLNYAAFDCEAVGFRNGVLVLSTNVTWLGGTVQSNGVDISIVNGVQGYATFGGFRSEGSQRLLNAFSSQQSPTMRIALHDVTFSLDSLVNNPVTSGPDLIFWQMPGSLSLRNIVALAGVQWQQAATSATSTTATSGWALPTANGGVTGWNAYIASGTGAGQRRTILSNTASTITVPAWDVTPDTTSVIQIYPAPRIYATVQSGAAQVIADGLTFMGTSLERAFASNGPVLVNVTSYAETDTGSLPIGSTVQGPIYLAGLSTYRWRQPVIGMGAIDGMPSAILTQHRIGVVGTVAMETLTLRARALGATPAPFLSHQGSGSTAWTYYLVAKDGSGNTLGLPSVAATVSGQAASLDATNYNIIWLPNADHAPAPAYDILRGDTGHAVARDVPWYRFPYKDMRATVDAYTAPTADETGIAQIDAQLRLGMTAAAATPGSVTAKFPIYDASGALVGYVPIYDVIT